ncbi:MAG: sulfatase-like hydrolase/transferase, partial [Vicinamibacterales bacterium]
MLSRRLLVGGGVLGAAVLATTGWLFLFPPEHLAGNVNLGALARGVDRDALNLVVVTLDTTRADRIGSYGDPRAAETPVFDRLAREGTLFERAMTSAPLTLPAHATMFTAQFPPAHGVRDNGGFFLSPDATTLAEHLRSSGVRTGAFVGAFVLDSKWGLDQGFEHYADDFDLTKVRGMSVGGVQRRADEVVDLALPWLETVKQERFFAWLHFYDPHTPYAPPEPFASRYSGRPYEGEIAFADAQLGRVVDFLQSRGLLERTIIAVLADHGEGLGEHGEGTHGFFIYESSMRAPFVIRAPFERTKARRVADPVRTVDLVPTLLDLLGLPALPARVAGTSLAPLMTGDRLELNLDGYAEAMYPLHHYGWSALRALRAGRFKLIDAPRPELYDLEQDPDERKNLFQERLALGQRMQTELRALEAQSSASATAEAPPADVDPEVRERLAALGYVGSFVASASSPDTVRADPKDKINLFNLMSQARNRARDDPDGAFNEVVALLEQVVEADPQVIDAWFSLGNEYFKQERFSDAIGYFKRALALKPDYDLALINLANSYRALGQDEAALAGYEHYLRVDPKNAWVHYQIGEICLDRDDVACAEARFNEAIAIDPNVAAARNALGALAFRRGDVATAERQI